MKIVKNCPVPPPPPPTTYDIVGLTETEARIICVALSIADVFTVTKRARCGSGDVMDVYRKLAEQGDIPR